MRVPCACRKLMSECLAGHGAWAWRTREAHFVIRAVGRWRGGACRVARANYRAGGLTWNARQRGPHRKPHLERAARTSRISTGALAAALALVSQASLADEGGVSFWIPGFFGSLAAAPQQPGFSVANIYYHTTVSAGADVSRAREITIGKIPANLSANLSANLDATRTSASSFRATYSRRQCWAVKRRCF